MSQRLAVVTGGIGGLGTEICRHLARAGRRVIAVDLGHQDERIAQFQQAVAEFGDAIGFQALDVGRAVGQQQQDGHHGAGARNGDGSGYPDL